MSFKVRDTSSGVALLYMDVARKILGLLYCKNCIILTSTVVD